MESFKDVSVYDILKDISERSNYDFSDNELSDNYISSISEDYCDFYEYFEFVDRILSSGFNKAAKSDRMVRFNSHREAGRRKAEKKNTISINGRKKIYLKRRHEKAKSIQGRARALKRANALDFKSELSDYFAEGLEA